jgi:hypothetical protein
MSLRAPRVRGKVIVDEADDCRAIAHGGGHAFHRAVPDVAYGEHAGGALRQLRTADTIGKPR